MSSRPLKGENMRRKRHEPLPPEALDEPFGPPPEEYLYRCPVCREEMLVNEAFIDAFKESIKTGWKAAILANM